MTPEDKRRDQLTEEKRTEIRSRLETRFDEGIVETKNSHLRQLAKEAVYDRLGIGYAMGLWDSFGMGDDYAEYQPLKIRMAKKLGVEADELFGHLEKLIQDEVAGLSATFETGQFGKDLKIMKEFALSKIEATRSNYAASYLRNACGDIIAHTLRAHPMDAPLDIESEMAALSWIGTDKEENPMKAIFNHPTGEVPDPAISADAELFDLDSEYESPF